VLEMHHGRLVADSMDAAVADRARQLALEEA
jgi:hypothetical protein